MPSLWKYCVKRGSVQMEGGCTEPSWRMRGHRRHRPRRVSGWVGMGRGLMGELLLPRVVVRGSGVRVVLELIRSFMVKMSYGRRQ